MASADHSVNAAELSEDRLAPRGAYRENWPKRTDPDTVGLNELLQRRAGAAADEHETYLLEISRMILMEAISAYVMPVCG